MLLFLLEPEDAFSKELAAGLGVTAAPFEERRFDDGERKLRPLVDPRGSDAFVVQSLHDGPLASPQDKLLRLLMFAATLHDHGAERVSAVVPYLAYARQDRRTQPFEPLSLRLLAQLFEAAPIDQVLVLEVHDLGAFQNAFRCPTVHLDAYRALQAPALAGLADARLAVASPDPGGVKRAQLWREALQEQVARPVGFAMVDKRRSAGALSGTDLVVGDVAGSTVLLLDDLISSGGTLRHAAQCLHKAGADRVIACAAHGLFTAGAEEALADPHLHALVVTDSVPPFRLRAEAAVRSRLRLASAAPLFAQAIRDLHAAWRS